jgi:DNA-binding transcriptional MerR regulator
MLCYTHFVDIHLRFGLQENCQEVNILEMDLISKKELLELTGLSYGQLYRWKRKNLIPEEWFIRKSTFTGQETFFPKSKILGRIEKIKNMKDELSLDELADLLSPNPAEVSLDKSQLLKRNIVSNESFEFYISRYGDGEGDGDGDIGGFAFERVLQLYIFHKLLQSGEINLEEGYMVLQVLHEHYPQLAGTNAELIGIRKMGFTTFLLVASPAHVYFESGIRIITRLLLSACIEELKLKINGGVNND